ncbi:hypothetical protein ARMGADRAFT_428618 [Armillaria gallica]|uniref:F-box domain-containing protein n=1 Tax=Armillaria gallica TaxID=47427 RepID=A0A2H3E234_ARMGA|nr:hypothetical protein ARMGADRAFT_428618 [Armillaria gallica]
MRFDCDNHSGSIPRTSSHQSMEIASSPTEDVLYNPDLLSIICWFLCRDPSISKPMLNGRFGIKSLCALALTCHAICDTALNYLWQDISGMKPLLSVFPRALSPTSNLPWILPGAISDKTWARFDLYSSRIRSINLDAHSHTLHSPTIFLRLSEKQEAFLPKLQKLTIDVAFAADPSVLLFLSSPLLDEVKITFSSDSEADMASIFIWTVGWKAPGLRSLTLAHERPPPRADDHVPTLGPIYPFSSFSDLRQLHNLNIETHLVDLNFLAQLSSCPRLANLHVIITQTGKPQKRQAQIVFPSLKYLHITACVSLMPDVLRLIRQGSLTSLTYRNSSDDNFSDLAYSVQAFHKELASRFPSLSSLFLYYYVPEEHRQSLRTVIQPLHDLPKLQKIIYHGVLCLDNDAVGLHLAVSWSRIRSLHISFLLGTSPTYGILAAVAKHCPLLADLSIPVTFPENDEPFSDDGVFSHRLHTFSAFHARVDCYASVAHYLDRMFPFLVSIEGGEGWDQVESIILKACQPARRDQLQRLRG